MADKTMVDYTRKIKPYFEGVAPIEPTSTAATAHTVGDIFYFDGTLVECTTAISIGDTIIVSPTTGYNVAAADNVVTQLKSAGDKVTIGYTGTASASGTKYERVGINGVYTEIDGTKYMEQTKTLSTSADTTYTFTNSAITADSLIDPYTSIFGVMPSNIVTTGGTCTVTIPSYSSAVSLKVRIYIRN